MAVAAVAFYSSSDFEIISRTTPSPSSLPKPFIGGLSSLLSSSPSSIFACKEETRDQPAGAYATSYMSLSSSFKRKDVSSPVSILQGPASSTSPPAGFSGQGSGGHLQFSPNSRCRRGHLLKGFAPNALRSYMDSPVCMVEGFAPTSKVNSSNAENACPLYAQELLEEAQSRHRIFNQKFVISAFYTAERAHRGQFRASGDPYLRHCLETAILLANIGANSTVVAAGLLHDTLDDAYIDYDHLSQLFGVAVADLVVGVSKLSQLSKLARENDTANKMAEADRLHTMFLAMADSRAVLVKLADRLHNMMTLESLPFAKQQRFAKESLEIFAPIANRLGIYCWKEHIESLCFKHLDPERHQELSMKLVNCFDNVMISSAIEKLGEALKSEGVSSYVLSGRHKSLYSIHRKMMKKKLNMDEIYDLHGLRLIVENEEDCYKSLGIVHRLWSKIPGKLKDYISHPKLNGYQSLHTVVMSEDMVPIEVQIRSKDMHSQAEYGFAAHWRYKEGDSRHSSNVLNLVEWARWIVTWNCKTVNIDEASSHGIDNPSSWSQFPFPSRSYRCPFFASPHSEQEEDDPIFVIMIENDKMSVQEFPPCSTVKDVTIKFGSNDSRWSPSELLLKEKLRPRLNYEPVTDLNQKLRTGDIVELEPAIPDKSLKECRKEIQRMYDGNRTVAQQIA